MIEIIICDDMEYDRKLVCDIVDDFFTKNKLAYKKTVFNDYTGEIVQTIDTKINKIYILDIEAPKVDGISFARKIRSVDLDSIIIFCTSYSKIFGERVLISDSLFYMSYLSKKDEGFDEKLKENLKIAIKNVRKRKMLMFKDNNISYILNLDDILYITTIPEKKKTSIICKGYKYEVYMPLNKLIMLLDDRFIKSHRSCYFNKENVLSMDKTNQNITFIDGTITDLVSRDFLKKIDKK